jgi:twitching motility protein PilT
MQTSTGSAFKTMDEDYFGLPSLRIVRQQSATGRNWEIAEFLGLITYAQAMEASDIHLKSGEPPRIRTVQGLLEPEQPEYRDAIMASSLKDFLDYLINLARLNERQDLERDGFIDFSVKIDNNSVRLSAYRENSGLALAVRFFYNRHVSVEFIGISELTPILDKQSGLFIATGPTGAGKTTTIAAMINHLNEREAYHIATIEDPVEYIYTDKRSRITQRSVPSHIPNFEEGLLAMMRQDPDVIVIGELRNRQMMKTSLLAAESGHLVLTTMHASSCLHAIHRFISFFPSDEQDTIRTMLADTTIGMCNQMLLQGRHGKWALAFELMTMNAAIANLIRENKLNGIEDVIRCAPGMISWDARLDSLMLNGQITSETWKRCKRDPNRKNPMEPK